MLSGGPLMDDRLTREGTDARTRTRVSQLQRRDSSETYRRDLFRIWKNVEVSLKERIRDREEPRWP